MKVNYGPTRCASPAPVPVGSKVRAGATVVSVERTAKGANMVVSYTIGVEGAEKPSLIAETVTVLVE